jgi:hypothetical protein
MEWTWLVVGLAADKRYKVVRASGLGDSDAPVCRQIPSNCGKFFFTDATNPAVRARASSYKAEAVHVGNSMSWSFCMLLASKAMASTICQ